MPFADAPLPSGSAAARRARYLQWALTAYYLAVGVFVADMMVIGLMALTSHSEVWPTVGLGLLGASMLLFGCMVLIAESRLALTTTYREMQFVRKLGEQRVPAEVRRRRKGTLSALRGIWRKRKSP